MYFFFALESCIHPTKRGKGLLTEMTSVGLNGQQRKLFHGFPFLFLNAITENEGRSPTPFVGGVSEY